MDNIKYVKFPEELSHIKTIVHENEMIVNTGYSSEEETEVNYVSTKPETNDRERLPSINEAIDLAIEDRYEDIANTKILTNKRYVEARSKVIELYKQLSDIIPAESKKMLIEYDDAEIRMSVIESTLFYKQGLRDGLALPKAWGGAVNG